MKMALLMVTILAVLLSVACGGDDATSTRSAPAPGGTTPAPTVTSLGATGGETTPTATAPGGIQPTITRVAPGALADSELVDITESGFSPAELEIFVGDTVFWTVTAVKKHTTTSGEPGAKSGYWDSKVMRLGERFSYKFNEVGVFPYFNENVPEYRGKITVKERK